MADESWAVVLAGGEGSRLRTLTTNSDGLVIPKQYCSLDRSTCLLQDALTRASGVVIPSRVCTVVAAQHRQWWASAVSGLHESNVIVQPENRGTALGILLALLTLEMRNPEGTVLMLPADHYFREESAINRILRTATLKAIANPAAPFLLGAVPDHPDAELGYILPSCKAPNDTPAPITGFKEKPEPRLAAELIARGALWNLFIMASSVRALLHLFSQEHGNLVCSLRNALRLPSADRHAAIEAFYASVQPIDFSHNILEVHADRLQVIRVPHCGWTDLGTPQRVEETVRTLRSANLGGRRGRQARARPLFFDLGEKCA